MIIELRANADDVAVEELAREVQALRVLDDQQDVLVTPAAVKTVPERFLALVENSWSFSDDLQLSSLAYRSKREVKVGHTVIGGSHRNTLIIAGPCSVESESQIRSSAELLASSGLKALRGGCFKPRTSPYSFQGLGLEGLQLLDKMRREYGFTIVSEVRDATHVQQVIEYSDVIQIGAKSMYDHGILRACAKTQKPVLIKRGFGTTLQEFAQAAEFVLSGGNPNVLLCERGIRTFETKTRFTLDLCGVSWLKAHTNLPIILDPSHALGYRYGIADLCRACLAMGADGLLIEVHPNPEVAKSDAAQQLTHPQFSELLASLRPIADAIGYQLV